MDVCPKGQTYPSGGRTQACLATDHHAEVSTLSGWGDRCIPYPDHYSPAFAFSAILYPQQIRSSLHRCLSCLAARHHYGLTLFRAMSTGQEGLAFLPVTVLSACPHQAGGQPVTYRFGPSLSVDLARQGLTTFISDSHVLALWPSLAPHPDFDFQIRVASLTARRAPREGWLRCRCARHGVVANPALHLGYWRLNARLHPDRDGLCNNSSHGLRRLFLRPPISAVVPNPFGYCCLIHTSKQCDQSQLAGRLSGRTLGKLPFCH